MTALCTTSLTVQEWQKNNCTNLVSNLTPAEKNVFFSQLFRNFSPPYIPGVQSFTEDKLNFQYLLADVCGTTQDIPAIGGPACAPPLTSICASYTRKDLENPVLRKLCGCYLPASEYLNVPQSCDPICSGLDTIKYYSGTSSVSVPCIKNLCVIDDVTLSLQNSTIPELSFSQVCPACAGSASCECVIADVNIITTNSQIELINFTQDCGGNSRCYAKNQDGSQSPVDCQTFFNSVTSSDKESLQKKKTLLELGISLLVIFLILTIIFWLASMYFT